MDIAITAISISICMENFYKYGKFLQNHEE